MNEGEEIRFIDLFSGIGGFRYGLEEANRKIWNGLQNLEARGGGSDASIGVRRRGVQSENPTHPFRCVWSCDNNKYANQVYTKQFGEANHHSGDVRGVDPGEIPDFDLLCAGFPCQSFSVAGKRKGFQDTRGTLFFEISRIAEAKRPQMLLLENVKGLLSSDRGQTFQTILQELGRIGYWAEWQVLNSKHHGVPQNRERVFIIGHLREKGGQEIFPFTKPSQSPNLGDARQQTASALQSPGHAAGNYRGMNMIAENLKIRRLTPTECERLQGFPEGWTGWGINDKGEKVIVSDTQRYRALGNAVTTNVVTFLGKRIMETWA